MKKILQSKIVKRVGLLFILGFVSILNHAQTVVITTGGTFPNFFFDPDSVNITDGDSVCIIGLGAATHPLAFASDSNTIYSADICFVLPVGTHYYYCVNHESFGMDGVIVVQPATGIKNINTADFQLTISPNPFYEYTTLKIKSSGQKINSFKVHNVIGKEIISYDLSDKNNTLSYKINFSGLEPGVYFCSIYTEMGLIETKKLVLLK